LKFTILVIRFDVFSIFIFMCWKSYLYLPLFKCKGDCLFSFESNKMPVPYVQYNLNGGPYEIIYPNSDGYLKLNSGINFQLTCSRYNTFVIDELTFGFSEIQVMCYQDDIVLFNGGYFKFEKFLCTDTPISDIVVTNEICKVPKNSVAYVGFQTSHVFLMQYGICFDTKAMNSLYTWYEARTPYKNQRVEYGPIPEFAQPSSLYKGLDVGILYEPQSQVSYRSILISYFYIGLDESEKIFIQVNWSILLSIIFQTGNAYNSYSHRIICSHNWDENF